MVFKRMIEQLQDGDIRMGEQWILDRYHINLCMCILVGVSELKYFLQCRNLGKEGGGHQPPKI